MFQVMSSASYDAFFGSADIAVVNLMQALIYYSVVTLCAMLVLCKLDAGFEQVVRGSLMHYHGAYNFAFSVVKLFEFTLNKKLHFSF